MTLFRLIVWRHLTAEPLRTALTVSGVGLGVAVYVAVAAANVEVLRSFEQAVLGVAGRTTLQVTAAVSMSQGFDETVIEPIRKAPGVLRATPVIEISGAWRASSRSPVALLILGVDLLEESSFRDYRLSAGSDPTGWEMLLEPDSVFLGRRVAARYGLGVGSILDIRAGAIVRRLVVRALVEGRGPSGSALEELALMDIAAAQWTFDRLGHLDRIDLVSDPAMPVEEVRGVVQAALPPSLLVKRPEQRNAQVERMTRAFRLNIMSLSVVALLVGLFLVYNTMSFAVVRRRREIGILRALGVSPAGIGRFFIAEALFLGSLGWLLGVGFGFLLSQTVLRTIGVTMRNLYDVQVLPQALSVYPGILGQSFLVGVGVAVLGALGPIREAVAVIPAQALAPKGYETSRPVRVRSTLIQGGALLVLAGLAAPQGPIYNLPILGYLAAFLLMAGLAWLSPVLLRALGPCLRVLLPRAGYLGRIAAAELDRAPVRNAVAVSAFMVGLALMIGMSVLIHSFRLTVDTWLDQTVKADVIVASPTWLGEGPQGLLPDSVRRRLLDLPGVIAVDGYRDLRMEFRDRPVTVVARDLLLHARHSRYLFIEGDSAQILRQAVRAGQIVVSESFARAFKLRQGDRVTLPGPGGPIDFLIAGIFYDYSTDGGKIVMDRTLYEQVWQDTNVTVVPIYLAAGADLEEVRRSIAARLGGDPPVMVLSNAELKREVLRIFDQTFGVTYALEVIAVIVALLGIVNCLMSGILERQTELAVLRAIGGTPVQIGRLILWESGLLGLAGTVLGLAGGLALSVLLIEVINKQSFGWTIMFRPAPAALVEAVGLALLTTLLAGYGPARRAARLPVSESLRYE